MATLIKKPTKRSPERRVWRANKMIRGRSHIKYFFPEKEGSLRKAHAKALAWEVEIERQSSSEKTPKEISLEEWEKLYLEMAQRNFHKFTYENKKRAFQRAFRHFHVHHVHHVSQIQLRDIEIFLSNLASESGGSVSNKTRQDLAAAWEWGKKNLPDFPRNNKFQKAGKKEYKEKERYVPPEKDFWEVFSHISGQDRIILLTFWYTGARKGEIIRLRREDIDLAQDRIRLWTRKRKNRILEYDWLPMPHEYMREMGEWLREREKQNDTDYVFVQMDSNGKPFRGLWHFMNKICKKANVRPFGFHAIRHLRASALYRDGAPLIVIQQLLRHRNPQTTERYLKSRGMDPSNLLLKWLEKSEEKRHHLK